MRKTVKSIVSKIRKNFLLLCLIFGVTAFGVIAFKATAQQDDKSSSKMPQSAGNVGTDVVITPSSQKGQAQNISTLFPAVVDDISPNALAQIEALIREKELRTDVQKKIDSQLIYQSKMARGRMVADDVLTLETGVVVDNNGKTIVDITARISKELLATLRANGAEIISAGNSSIRANVSLERLEQIAASADVKFVQPKQEAMTSQYSSPMVADTKDVPLRRNRGKSPDCALCPMVDDLYRVSQKTNVTPGFEQRGARVREILANALQGEGSVTNVTGTNAPTGVGSRNSEGDVTHRANVARGTFHIDGTGIKIGVISNGVVSLAQSQALGDLGPVTILPGQTGTGDEGTAMLEIIHDLAPGAELYFATSTTSSITQFAQNIRDLRTAGCDIIVDDVSFFVETPFQDGQLAPTNTNGGAVIQAVNDVTADGALYFSSAGNSGNLSQSTSGVWEGDFVDGGAGTAPLPVPAPPLRLHNFGGQNFNVLTVANTAAPISLYWSDPLGASSNDYDLFRLNSTGTTVQASSTNIQSGTQDPYEQVSQAAGSRIVIVKKPTAADRFLHLNSNRGQFSIRTAGQTHGHSHAANAYSVAATPAVGPYPNLFSAANITETFSSDGPRRIFFQADGTPYTPGNLSSTGGIVRQKPDITAADGVQVTGVGGFGSPFFGTSAAAPHAAAIAALLKSANPSFTPAQIRTALTSTAIDIMGAGVDNVSGAGIIDPFAATQSLGVTGTAFMQSTNITALENPGNGNGVLDAGENATMTVQLRNDGINSATAISATLSSSTPGVTITQASSAYPDLAVGASGTNTTPYQFSIAGFVTCPTTLNFSLTVNYTGGPSQVINFSVLAGPQPTVISSTLDTTPPGSGAGFTGTTGALTIRHFRDSIVSSCGTQKPFPGTSTPGNHQYDAYQFQTCATSGPTCVTVTLNAANGVNLFSAAYLGTFNPANLAQNYIADAGGSNTTVSYSFNLPAGAQTFTVVVEDVPVGVASNSPYTLSVSGACVGACPIVPVLASNGATISTESCPAFNGAADPGETVTMNLKIVNNGTGSTSNLVGTLQASANVTAPSGPTSFGSIAPGATVGKDFSFTVAGSCGDLVTLALKLQDGAVDFGTVFYSFRLGVGTPGAPLSENFDGVTAPALPAGWTSTGSGALPAWVTSTTNPSSAPNAAFAPNLAAAGVTELVSPTIHINGSPAQVSFKNAFNTENEFDGGVLEISINGGAYQDIIAAGGSFVSGGYTDTLRTATQNPLTGRSAWSGLSGGTTAAPAYITSVVNLPAAAAGQDIQLKWRMGSDELIAAAGTQPGQRIDDVVVSDTSYACTVPCPTLPPTTTTVTSSANPSVFGQNVTFTATVSPNPGAGETVNFVIDGGAPIPTMTNASGEAIYSTSSLTVGTHTVTANFAGTPGLGSSSGSLTPVQTVNKANTTLTITNAATLSSTPTTTGQPYAVNWSVSVNSPGSLAAALTGNVTASDGTDSCMADVSVGTCNLTSTTTGLKTITVTYVGDSNYNGDNDTTTHQVNPCSPSVTVMNNADSGAGSLRQAVLDVCPGGTITFAGGVTSPISQSGGQIAIAKNLTITGPGANLLTVQNTAAASPTSRIFQVNSGLIVNISGLTLTGGNTTTSDGGAVYNAGTLTLTNMVITANTGSSTTANGGGGIFNLGTLNLNSSTISNNISGGGGGGIMMINGGTAVINDSTISGNSSTGGGAIMLQTIGVTGFVTITNSTISGNSASPCPGIWNLQQLAGTSSTVNVSSSTITNNNGPGGGICANGPINIDNTIVAGNQNTSANVDVTQGSFGTFASNGYNLIGNRGSVATFNNTGDQKGTGAAPLDAKLAPLANNGGMTQTHRLRAGSPALDKSNSFGLTTDQRGLTRPVNLNDSIYPNAMSGNGADIGAFEAQTPPIKVPLDFDGDGKSDYAVVQGTFPRLLGEKSRDDVVLSPDLLASERQRNWARAYNRLLNLRAGRGFIELPKDVQEAISRFKHDETLQSLIDKASTDALAVDLNWQIRLSSNGTTLDVLLGTQTDEFVPADYDGDGKTDVAVWNGTQFRVKTSSSNFATEIDYTLGTTGSDPTVVGDYDGDGLDDPAVYDSATGLWSWLGGASHNSLGSQVWMPNGIPAPGDYNGDGKIDFAVQLPPTASPDSAKFRIAFNDGSVGAGADISLTYGLAVYAIVPGDYDGDGKCDIAQVNMMGTTMGWRVLTSSSNYTMQIKRNFGTVSSDRTVHGDYDGDGKIDMAIYRRASSPNDGVFIVFQSSTNTQSAPFDWGDVDDYPVGFYNSH